MNFRRLKNQIKNDAGQATVEAILIMTVLLGVSGMISKGLTGNKYFATLIEGPWDYVDGMIQDGVWMKRSSASHAMNPNSRSRHQTKQTDPGRTQDKNYDAAESGLL